MIYMYPVYDIPSNYNEFVLVRRTCSAMSLYRAACVCVRYTRQAGRQAGYIGALHAAAQDGGEARGMRSPARCSTMMPLLMLMLLME